MMPLFSDNSNDDASKLAVVHQVLKRYPVTISAASGAAVSVCLGYPFDSVKTRLQTFKYDSVYACVKKTYKHEGVLGFFRGIATPFLTIILARAFCFSVYDDLLKKLHSMFDIDSTSQQPLVAKDALCTFAAGSITGAVTASLFSPLELAKTAAQLDRLVTLKRFNGVLPADFKLHGSISSLINVAKKYGLPSLYTGYKFSILRDLIGTGSYFLIYEQSKSIFARTGVHSSYLPALSGFFCGSLSWLLVFPLDTIKNRMQRDLLSGRTVPKGYTPSMALYNGLMVSVMRSAVINSAYFSVYEYLKGRIKNFNSVYD